MGGEGGAREGQLLVVQMQAGAHDIAGGEARPVVLPLAALEELPAVVPVVPVAARLPPAGGLGR